MRSAVTAKNDSVRREPKRSENNVNASDKTDSNESAKDLNARKSLNDSVNVNARGNEKEEDFRSCVSERSVRDKSENAYVFNANWNDRENWNASENVNAVSVRNVSVWKEKGVNDSNVKDLSVNELNVIACNALSVNAWNVWNVNALSVSVWTVSD